MTNNGPVCFFGSVGPIGTGAPLHPPMLQGPADSGLRSFTALGRVSSLRRSRRGPLGSSFNSGRTKNNSHGDDVRSSAASLSLPPAQPLFANSVPLHQPVSPRSTVANKNVSLSVEDTSPISPWSPENELDTPREGEVDELPYPGFVDKVFHTFKQTDFPRNWALRIVNNPYPHSHLGHRHLTDYSI